MFEERHGVTASGATVPVADLRAFLIGRWRIERRIDDRRRGERGRFAGTGTYTPDGDGLLYEEIGQFTLPGHRGEAEQRHRYHFPTAGRALVHFRDGGFFHDLDLTAGTWQADHPCGEDLYAGSFRAGGPDRWTQIWTVSGPRKALVLTTDFGRALLS